MQPPTVLARSYPSSGGIRFCSLTSDVPPPTWSSKSGSGVRAHDFKVFKDLMYSSSDLGRIHGEKQIIEFLSRKIGPLLGFPEYKTRLLEKWERGTGNKFRGFQFIPLPFDLVQDWKERDKRLSLSQMEYTVSLKVEASL
jgi:hypothetical protein